jgi:ATP-dependent RNA helicase SUPV3L1/SUV3
MRRLLTVSEIKQIGGRAGRYKSSFAEQQAFMGATPTADAEMASEMMAEKHTFDDADGEELATGQDDASSDGGGPTAVEASSMNVIPRSVGMIGAFTADALSRIRGAMKTDAWPLRKAGVFPTRDMIELFCSYFPPGVPYGFILARLNEISKLSGRYFLCRMNDTVGIADAIEEVRGLSIEDRILCCYAPVNARREREMDAILEMARCIANQAGGGLLELKSVDLDLLDRKPIGDREYLWELELLHKLLVLYSWMSYRFPGVFGQRPLAVQAKRVTEDAINAVLAMLSAPEPVPVEEEEGPKYYRGPPVMAIPELAGPAEEASEELSDVEPPESVTARHESTEEGLYDVTIGKVSEEAASLP